MEEVKNKQSVYTEPELQIIHMIETDIITSSGDFRDDEGEIIPVKVDADNQTPDGDAVKY